AKDFHRDAAAITHSTKGLTSEAAALRTLRDAAVGDLDGARANFVLHLAERLHEAARLSQEVAAADRAAAETGRVTAEAAGKLIARVSAIQAIKVEVNLMALNAAIKCSRLAEPGRPLAVIAVELRDQGDELDRLAAQALDMLSDFTEVAAA